MAADREGSVPGVPDAIRVARARREGVGVALAQRRARWPLPPRTEQTVNVEMDAAERAFYEALRQRAVETIAALDAPRGKRKIQILAEITRLRRPCCNPALIDAAAAVPSGKLDAFLELVQDLVRNRHRALVFSQFVGHLALVRAALDAAASATSTSTAHALCRARAPRRRRSSPAARTCS